MKSIKITAVALGLLALASCKDQDLPDLHNQAFIAQTDTQTNKISSVALSDTDNVPLALNIQLSDVQTEDRKFKVVVSPEALEAFNKANGTELKSLPAEFYTLEKSEVVIKAGATLSEPLDCVVKPLSQELLNSGESYAVAFKLESTDGSCVVKGGDVFVYTLRPTIVTSVPVLGTYNSAYIGAKASNVPSVDLTSWTVEMRVNMNGFRKNNQALFGNWGTNSEIYIRFGDAPTPFNTLQVKWGKGQFDQSNTVFAPNTWYHIAVVYDGAKMTLYVNGQKDLETDKVGSLTFNVGPDIHIANSGFQWFVNAAMMSEVRFWGTARTQKQIAENQYVVSPKTPGLLHYWKMNEGQGNVFKNSVAGGPDVVATSIPSWKDNVRSDGKGRTSVD